MKELFFKQTRFQEKITKQELPIDNAQHFMYHMNLMIEELGELAKTDKRWRAKDGIKTQSVGNKLDEIADVFIVAMNLSMYSGFSYEDIYNAIQGKIVKNEGRLPND